MYEVLSLHDPVTPRTSRSHTTWRHRIHCMWPWRMSPCTVPPEWLR